MFETIVGIVVILFVLALFGKMSGKQPDKPGPGAPSVPGPGGPAPHAWFTAQQVTTDSVLLQWDVDAALDPRVREYVLGIGSSARIRQYAASARSVRLVGLKPASQYLLTLEAKLTDGSFVAIGAPLLVQTQAASGQKPTWPTLAWERFTLSGQYLEIAWPAASHPEGVAHYQLQLDGEVFVEIDGSLRSFFFNDLKSGKHTLTILARGKGGLLSDGGPTQDFEVVSGAPAPTPEPDPLPDVPALPAPAPALPASEISGPGKQFSFIFEGPNALQRGVRAGAIESRRVSMIRGRAVDRQGAPVAGATVSVLGKPELGATTTLEDGQFFIAANGGENLALEVVKPGYLKVQRRAQPAWLKSEGVATIVLSERKAEPIHVDFQSNASGVLVQGKAVSDRSGQRRLAIFFPPGVQPSTYDERGQLGAQAKLALHVTEFTEGEFGSRAMPGELPTASAYTYAVEITAEEARRKIDGRDILFDREVFVWVDNFLGFPTGSSVPAGFLDDDASKWKPDCDGRVVACLPGADGAPVFDLDGSGRAASEEALTALDFSPEERRSLASHCQPGRSYWRVPVMHFSIWDYNWPFSPPADARPPKKPAPPPEEPPEDCKAKGSVILAQKQVLATSVTVPGTLIQLCYHSGRVPGYLRNRIVDLPLEDPDRPASVKQIDLSINIAGRLHEKSFEANASGSYRYLWDGRDAFGRALIGRQSASVKVGYRYDGVYQDPGAAGRAFSRPAGTPITGNRSREEVTLWSQWTGQMGNFLNTVYGLGGWSLDVLHTYDPQAGRLYFGGGREESIEAETPIIETIAGSPLSSRIGGDGGPAKDATFHSPRISAANPDNSFYIADGFSYVRFIDAQGGIRRVAGNGKTYSGDNAPGNDGPALDAPLAHVAAVAPDGSGGFFIVDSSGHCVRRVDAAGIIRAFAGRGFGFAGDGGPATEAKLNGPTAIAVAPDGSAYISDTANHVIRQVTADGFIHTIAGKPRQPGYDGDGGPAAEAKLNSPTHLAIGPDGSIYFSDTKNHCVRRMGPNGAIATVAGTGQAGEGGDFGPATQAQLDEPWGLAFTDDGELLIADRNNARIRIVDRDGRISVFAGSGKHGHEGDGGSCLKANLLAPTTVCVLSGGDALIGDIGGALIRKVSSKLQSLDESELLIRPKGAQEAYVFNNSGRHLRTVNPLTKATLLSFEYAPNGFLQSVSDGSGQRVLATLRDGQSRFLGFQDARGRALSATLDAEGWLASFPTPGGGERRFVYQSGGLLTGDAHPTRGSSRYRYDNEGLLAKATSPEGYQRGLQRAVSPNGGNSVILTHGEARTSSYENWKDEQGRQRMLAFHGCGLPHETIVDADGTRRVHEPSGMKQVFEYAPDPILGMKEPYVRRAVSNTPGGLRRVVDRALAKRPGSTRGEYEWMELRATEGDLAVVQTHDRARRLSEVSLPGAPSFVQVRFDAEGRTESVKIQGQPELQIQHDERGRRVALLSGQEPISRMEYDAQDRLVAQLSANGRRQSYSYSENNDRVTMADQLGKIAEVAFDDELRYQALVSPLGGRFKIEYDSQDRLARYAFPQAGSESSEVRMERGADGLLARIVYGAKLAVEMERDAAGNVVRQRHPGGASVDFEYDGLCRRLSRARGSNGVDLSYRYDGALLVEQAWDGPVRGRVATEFDNSFRPIRWRISEEVSWNIEYKSGNLAQAGDLKLAYNAQAQRLETKTLRKLAQKLRYDAEGNLSSIETSCGGALLCRQDFDRQRGLLVRERESGVEGLDRVFEYDLRNRLVAVREGAQESFSCSYDANGNRTSLSRNGAKIEARCNAQDQLVAFGEWALAYDAKGDLQTKRRASDGATLSLKYGYQHQLTEATLPDGRRVEYLIDGSSRRVGKRVDGKLAFGLLYQDSLRPIAELDENGALKSAFVYASGTACPDFMLRGGRSYFFVKNAQGSPILIVDADSGEIAQRLRYDALGRVVEDTSPGFQPFGFAGGIYDSDTGLVRFGFRDYDPETGVWTGRDPMLHMGGSLNFYAYCDGDPVNRTDFSGLAFNGWAKAGIAAAGLLIAGGIVAGLVAGGALAALAAGIGIAGLAGAIGSQWGVPCCEQNDAGWHAALGFSKAAITAAVTAGVGVSAGPAAGVLAGGLAAGFMDAATDGPAGFIGGFGANLAGGAIGLGMGRIVAGPASRLMAGAPGSVSGLPEEIIGSSVGSGFGNMLLPGLPKPFAAPSNCGC